MFEKQAGNMVPAICRDLTGIFEGSLWTSHSLCSAFLYKYMIAFVEVANTLFSGGFEDCNKTARQYMRGSFRSLKV